MRNKPLLIRSLLSGIFMFLSFAIYAQGPYPNTGNQTVCLNAIEPYGVVLNAGSTYNWTLTPITTGNGTITAGATQNLITITWTSTGTATLQVVETNAQGCQGTPVTIIVTVIPKPNLLVTNPAAVCSPNTVDITAASVTAGSSTGLTLTYWTNPGATIPYTTPTVATNGTYYIKGTNASGCYDIKPVTVTVNPTPLLVITNPPAACTPSTVDITAAAITNGSTGGLILTYWTTAAATTVYTTPTAATNGTYYIKGTNASGCYDIKPVTVTVTNTPTLAITNPAPVCAPATIDITTAAITAGSTAGLTLTYWTNAATTTPYTTATTATSGTYYIKGTAAGGCYDIKPVTVLVNPLPAPSISGPTPVCESVSGNVSTYSTANVIGHSYNWTVTNGTLGTGQGTNQINVTWPNAGSGNVSVTETITSTGCNATASQSITINPKPVTTPITHN